MMNPGQTTVEADAKRVREAFVETFGINRVVHRVALAPLTTFRTGGKADWFIETRRRGDIVRAMRLSHQLGLPVTLLGGGSNVLVGERGIRGLVLRIWHGDITVDRPGVVRADAGVTLNGLVRWTVSRGLAGLERWAGTPGTIGGGLCGNAHFQGELLGDHVLRVCLVDRQGHEATVDVDAMEFGYDASRLQNSGEAVLWAEFAVHEEDAAILRARARTSLAYRKQTQPLAAPSAGCIFQNPDPGRDQIPEGMPWSAGALIDRAGVKGRSVGRAMVSPVHGNFIVTNGRATVSDVRQLIEECREEVRRRFGVVLRDEIVYVGEFETNVLTPSAPSKRHAAHERTA